jgi:hypothetical protein
MVSCPNAGKASTDDDNIKIFYSHEQILLFEGWEISFPYVDGII